MRTLFLQISIIFHLFCSSHATYDFSPSFSPNFHYFINKCQLMSFCLSKTFSIAFTNFLSHNKPMNTHTRMSCPPFNLEYVSHNCGLIYILHGIFTRIVTEPSPLGEHHPRCSMTPITNKTIENKTYYPWSFIT